MRIPLKMTADSGNPAKSVTFARNHRSRSCGICTGALPELLRIAELGGKALLFFAVTILFGSTLFPLGGRLLKSLRSDEVDFTALPAHLPREINLIPLSPEERACPGCGSERPVIGYESAERLDYVPATLKVVETRREKCACQSCEGQLATAPAPAQVIEQGIPLPGLLAHVLMAKYGDHLPLYRIEQQFIRLGVPIARATLCDWVLQCGAALLPLVLRMMELLKEQAVIFSDDTTVALQAPGKT